MPYKAIRRVNTEFKDYMPGDIAPDVIGEKYAGFEKIVEEAPKAAPKKAPKKSKKKKEEPKEEILTEVSSDIEVEITEE